MAMLCAISGVVPEDPVISKKTGHVFQKQLIEKYVAETGKCPITSQELSADDLLPLATSKNVKPRGAAATSIPGLLGLFHDEWDALMLEHHTLRQNLHTVRQELSHALYQHDAACRVIARLIRERDEARAALTTLRDDMRAEMEAAAEARKRAGEEEEAAPAKRSKQQALGQEVIDVLEQTNTALSSGRRKRAIPAGTAAADDIAAYTLLGSFPLHKTTQPGILALALHPEQGDLVATCGADATVQLFDIAQQRQITSLTGHSKKVTAAAWGRDSLLVTASNDKTVRFWKHSGADDAEDDGGSVGSWACGVVGTDHAGEVRGLALHPSRSYVVSVSEDASWAWWDLDQGSCLKQAAGSSPYTATSFHPDGLLLITGTTDSKAQIWEMRQQKAVTGFDSGGAGPLLGFSFSENGYHVASVTADVINVWDLRKMKCFKEVRPYDDAACKVVAYDYSSQFLAVGGADLRVYAPKQDWSVVKSFPDIPKKGVFSVAWSPLAKSIVVGGGDHNLRVFTAAAATTAAGGGDNMQE